MGIKAMVNKLNDLLMDDCTIELSAWITRDYDEEFTVCLKWEPKGAPIVQEVRSSYCILEALKDILECVSETIEPLKAARKSLVTKVKTLPIEDLKRIEESGIIEGWTMPDKRQENK